MQSFYNVSIWHRLFNLVTYITQEHVSIEQNSCWISNLQRLGKSTENNLDIAIMVTNWTS